MTKMHWAAIAAFLAATAGQVATIPHWEHVTSPSFVSFLLAQAGAMIMALAANKPEPDRVKHPRRFDRKASTSILEPPS